MENSFTMNQATENGAALYISNNNSFSQIVIASNNFVENQIIPNNDDSEMMGSIIYLQDPGLIKIINSSFVENLGIMGTCIYYSESISEVFFRLEGNYFEKNMAKYGGAAIYFENNFEKFLPLQANTFFGNIALFAKDVTTSPFRMNLLYQKYDSQTNNKLLQLNVIPGITEIDLYFTLLDYYNQKISSINIGSSNAKIRSFSNFSKKLDLEILGKATVAVSNGIFRKFIENH